jgi:proline racemase/trans-L-3-hydroxyproline dehydratase
MEVRRIQTVDYHTAGEPFRIVPRPPVEIRGSTVAQRRVLAMNDPAVDGLRRVLCFEPRGHADMYGGFVVPPDDEGARFGVPVLAQGRVLHGVRAWDHRRRRVGGPVRLGTEPG